ncbi:Zinc finger bed domain-containing protein ricesleeper [Thalictrum thalictroides]|uniref:Zinc finger bed domain-containing protein ricesleeper n=1 Tax=Thalictrum thalictroides TaxID=46969 RepID=A0A7J6X1U3_THATH|nr:Zinc finger bed domain-containing protein ricesleeper [Thalictrum thalictroides]
MSETPVLDYWANTTFSFWHYYSDPNDYTIDDSGARNPFHSDSNTDEYDRECNQIKSKTFSSRCQLANMIVKGKISLQMLEQEDYLRYLKHHRPEMEMVSMNDIKSDYLMVKSKILRDYDMTKKRNKEEMLGPDGNRRICLMVDIWNSKQPELVLMCLSASFIDTRFIDTFSISWTLVEIVLNLRQLPSPLNDDDLTEAILLCLSEWDIEDNISTITFRNSAAYDSVAARIRIHLNKKNVLPLDGMLFHVRCIEDILNSMVQTGMAEVDDIVNKLPEDQTDRSTQRPMYSEWESAWVYPCESARDSEWDSAQSKLKMALMDNSSFVRSHSRDILTKYELRKVKGTLSLIELIKNLADTCSPKNSYPTTCFHNFLVFREQLAEKSMSSDRFVGEVAKKMLVLFNKYWEDMFMVMAMVMIIDPHFKLKYLEFFFTKNSGNDAKISLELVREAIFNLYKEYLKHEPSVKQVEMGAVPYDKKQLDASNHYVSWLDKYSEATIKKLNSELNHYFDKEVLIMSSLSYNVLQWWQFGNHDPRLSRMACDILAIGMAMTINPKRSDTYKAVRDKDPFSNSLDPSMSEALFYRTNSIRTTPLRSYLYSSMKHSYRRYHSPGTYDFEHGAKSEDSDQPLKDCLNRNDRETDPTNKLAELVYRDCLPLHIVENENFLALVEPEFKMVKLENVKSQILETYKKWKENVKKFLLGESEDDRHAKCSNREKEKSPGRISLAIDNWRSTSYREFLCITAHFIDSGWNFKKLILSFVEVSVPLTVENLTEAILRCISSWGIGEKIFSITSRNSLIFEGTSLSLQKCLSEKVGLPLDGMFFRVQCCKDIFNEIVREGFNEIAEIIGKVREVSGDKTLQNLQIDKQWNMTYLLLKKAIKSKVSCSASEVAYTAEGLSMDEWKKVEGICILLKIFHDVASILSRTEQTTVDIYFHGVCVVRGLLTQHSTSSDNFVSSMARKMLGRLDKYWKDMFMVLAVGSVMGPRFRMKYLEYVLPKCDDIDSNALLTQVQEAISGIYSEYASKPTLATNLEEDSIDHCPRYTHKDFNYALLKEYHDFVQSPSTKSEWNQYVDDWTEYKHDGDALSWWGTYCDKYPTLSRMARDILAIPISVVTKASLTSGGNRYSHKPVSDTSAFFSEDRELNQYLSSLDPDIMEALICMREWKSR